MLGDQDDASLTPEQDSVGHRPDTVSPSMIEDFSLPQGQLHDFGSFSLQDPTYGSTAAAMPFESQNAYPGYSLSHEHEREM